MKRIAAGILAFILAAAAQAGPWPTDNITTTHVDQSADDPSQARAEIYNTMLRVKDMIGARGSASGVAQLDASGLVPLANIPATLTGKDADTVDGAHAGVGPNNVLKLDASGLVPLANIPATLTGKSADTLDGIDSPSFARRDAANTFTAAATFSGGITTTTINATGAATLSGGITTSNSNMHIDPAPGTGATYLNYFSGTGGVIFSNGAGGAVARVTSSGVITSDHVVPGYVTGATEYLEGTTGSVNNVFDVTLNISAAWESVGPTGSGATNVWTALDAVPAGAKWVELKFQLGSGNSSGSFAMTKIYARKSATTSAADSVSLVADSTISATGASAVIANTVKTARVPLDASRRFDLYVQLNGTGSAYMYLSGFGI